MEKNFKYLLRHPRSRLIVAYFSVWLMFAESPVAHSSANTRVDVVGHAYALIFRSKTMIYSQNPTILILPSTTL